MHCRWASSISSHLVRARHTWGDMSPHKHTCQTIGGTVHFVFVQKWVYEVKGIQGLDSQYEVQMNRYIHNMKNFKWIDGIQIYRRTIWFETFFTDKSNGVVILIKHGTSTPLWVNGKTHIAWCQEKCAVVFLKSLIFSLKLIGVTLLYWKIFQ